MLLRSALLVSLCLLPLSSVYADLNQYMVRTTEWLVDHSTTICIADFSDKEADSTPKVLHTIKGDSKTLAWPLKKADFDGFHYFGPPASGTVRLLFIGENHELWQAVDLGRHPIDSPTLHNVFYGVNQYGEVHLTESSLMHAIRTHMAAEPAKPVKRRKASTHFGRSGIEAPRSFPFENGGETFVLVVDFNTRRRDYNVALLQTGDCDERVHAIKELSQLEDTKATSAIRAATRASGVEQSHVFKWSDRRVHSQADIVVQTAARDAMKRIERAP